MAQGTLILSPHPDDAALSLGGSIATNLLPPPITLLTIFGRSHYSEQTPGGGEVEQITALRHAEEIAYAHRRDLELVWLACEEAGLRLGLARVFAQRGQPPVDCGRENDIVAAARGVGAALVLAPLAVGEHVDHVIVHRLANHAAGGAALAYYEDLPYAARVSERSLRARAEECAADLTPVELALGKAGLAAKLEDLQLYPSQMTARHVAFMRRRRRAAVERLWATPAARAALAQ
jgi:LmbE family N-acetylglucosaminyl deacetylase